MTVKQVYSNTLIELSKVNAPALKLYEFNYYLNKAAGQYVNQIYSLYDTSQQTTDDLRALQGSVTLVPSKCGDEEGMYEVMLPMDYMHLLNCVCVFEAGSGGSGCHSSGSTLCRAATKLTSDALAMVLDDFYNRPSYKRPYFQIIGQRAGSAVLPVDPVKEIENAAGGEAATVGTDIGGVYGVDEYDSDTLADGIEPGTNFKRTFTFSNGHKESLVERTPAQRIGNPTGVRMELRCGSESRFALMEVQVDYVRVPQYMMMTQKQLDLTQDTSQILEWPDYVCQEITNILVRLVMERTSDPRLSTNIQINSSIARTSASAQQA